MINIKSPIWSSQSVGISKYKVKPGTNEVQITYRDIEGRRIYPNVFSIDSIKIRKCPIQMVKSVPLYIVPIKEMSNE